MTPHADVADFIEPITFVYTVQLRHAIYVLHAFQKKSKRGSKTPQADLDLIRRRLKDAEFYDKDEGNA